MSSFLRSRLSVLMLIGVVCARPYGRTPLHCPVSCMTEQHGAGGRGPAASNATLAEQRRLHPTRLRVHGPAPQDYDNTLPSDQVQQVMYTSQGRRLLAWLVKPDMPGPHPALLYAHGGFALKAEDYEDVRPFVQAGYIVLLPAWRGENGNPGEFERYCGEVDDALAALDYLATVPGVDPKRLFAAGHTQGGATALLLAESTQRLRGVAACSAFPDIQEAIAHGLEPQQKLFPYDFHDPQENDLRSPGRHLRDLNCPLFLYNSDSDVLYVRQAQALSVEAHRLGKQVAIRVFAHTTQHGALAPAIHAMIAAFKTGGN